MNIEFSRQNSLDLVKVMIKEQKVEKRHVMYNPLVIDQAVMMKIEQLWISVRGVQI